MDFQNRVGGKCGTVIATWSESNRHRHEQLRQIVIETADMNKDPYFMKNHIGSYECKLCLTLHNSEGSYLAHTQGKKHTVNLARRAAKESSVTLQSLAPEKPKILPKKFVKIGRPGYKITKQKDPITGQQSLLFQIDYPEIVDNVVPKHRFMSAYEQRIEPPDRKWQYILFAAEPYETIAIKVPSREIDKAENKVWTHWNEDTKIFFMQISFKMEKSTSSSGINKSLPVNSQIVLNTPILSVPPPPPKDAMYFFTTPPPFNLITSGIPMPPPIKSVIS